MRILFLLLLGACATLNTALPPENKTIALLGDSHSDYYGNPVGTFGYFGYHMRELIPGLQLIAASGATPSWFVTGYDTTKWGCTVNDHGCAAVPTIPKADTYLVELGANMVGWSEAKITGEVKALTAKLGQSCYWIGKPPDAETSTTEELRIEGILSRVVAPCKYISSRFFKFQRGTDNEHMNKAAATEWADGIFARIK